MHPARGHELEKPMSIACSKVPDSSDRGALRTENDSNYAVSANRTAMYIRPASISAISGLAGGRDPVGGEDHNMIDKAPAHAAGYGRMCQALWR